jgi:hypothetical protein
VRLPLHLRLKHGKDAADMAHGGMMQRFMGNIQNDRCFG